MLRCLKTGINDDARTDADAKVRRTAEGDRKNSPSIRVAGRVVAGTPNAPSPDLVPALSGCERAHRTGNGRPPRTRCPTPGCSSATPPAPRTGPPGTVKSARLPARMLPISSSMPSTNTASMVIARGRMGGRANVEAPQPACSGQLTLERKRAI